ncbi:K channel inward rectifier conserved region 2 domain protein [Gloeothece citriformis PCC 7424]|uniref:K channel inward rectifier conserved region 2 domain protein n=1 Tax=Gloeothece citriformis (strain PCC 7424) TaxID=65393 RepID=B7KEM4_GLOC7|nr:ion channel [Gloeothece citriformis]ACK69049.1 K channel inward rectifier conserved region 2 domain protein [Gloeothece citriformis PCC 7424]
MKLPKRRFKNLSKNPFSLTSFFFLPSFLFFPSSRRIKQFKSLKNQQNIDSLYPIWRDLYHWLLRLSWTQFLMVIVLVYLGANFLFALIYLTAGDGIANARPGSLTDAFFFSIQTLSTVGYGSMYPQTLYTQILVTVEILAGLVLIAIFTGLMFARFAKPTAQVLFSKVAVICPYNGIPTLMFRTANRRDGNIIEAQIQVSFLRNEISSEGHQLRRFYDINLTRSRSPIFGLSWLVMHPIDEKSPLFGETPESLEAVEGELWVTLTGIEETFSQTIHTHYSYQISDILWNRRFVDIFSRQSNGDRYIDLSRFHEVTALENLTKS